MKIQIRLLDEFCHSADDGLVKERLDGFQVDVVVVEVFDRGLEQRGKLLVFELEEVHVHARAGLKDRAV